jgi:MFS family permease
MFGWYRELTGREKRTLWACAGGWGLDGMDVQIYSFLIPTLISIWGISQTQAGALGTAALISSAIGGWGTGMLADRFGRVRMLQISICWYAGFTFLSGFTTSYDQLLVARTLQGIGFGGEWAAGSVLMGEMIRAAHRGKAVGCVQSAFAVGWGCAALLSTGFFALLPAAWAWRALFWAGLAPALLILFVRRHVRESEVFETARSDAAARGTETPLTAIFGRGLLRTTVLASLLALGVQGSSYAVITWLPTYLRTIRHLSATSSGSYVMVVTLGAFCGYITSAYLTDAVGRRRNFLIYAIGCWVIDFTYMYAPVGNGAILLLGFPFGFFTQGIYASVGPYFTELFPTNVRANGQAFAYSFGRCVGAFFALFIGLMSEVMPLDRAIGALSLGGYVLTLVAAFMLPETKGLVLAARGGPVRR